MKRKTLAPFHNAIVGYGFAISTNISAFAACGWVFPTSTGLVGIANADEAKYHHRGNGNEGYRRRKGRLASCGLLSVRFFAWQDFTASSELPCPVLRAGQAAQFLRGSG